MDKTKIVVPLMGKNQTEINTQLSKIRNHNPDIVEWRIDGLDELPDKQTVGEILTLIKLKLSETPVLATFRTIAEGGKLAATHAQYFDLLGILAEDTRVDFLDIEINHSKTAIEFIIQKARKNHIQIITSYHNFKKTPSDKELSQKLASMTLVNPDIVKLAVMPRSAQDVLRLMTFSLTTSSQISPKVVTMAMGDLGKITRISSCLTQSYFTFAAIDSESASAPGQIDIEKLREILDELN